MNLSTRFLFSIIILSLSLTIAPPTKAQNTKSTTIQDINLKPILSNDINRRTGVYGDSILIEKYKNIYEKGTFYFETNHFDSSLTFLQKSLDIIFNLDPSAKKNYSLLDINIPLEKQQIWIEDKKLSLTNIELKSYKNIIKNTGEKLLSNEAKKLNKKYIINNTNQDYLRLFPFTKFIEIWYDQIPILFMIGNIYEKKGMYDDALYNYYALLKLSTLVVIGSKDKSNLLSHSLKFMKEDEELLRSIIDLLFVRENQNLCLLANCFFQIESISFNQNASEEVRQKSKNIIKNAILLEVCNLFSVSKFLSEAKNKYPKMKNDIKKLEKECALLKANLEKDQSFSNIKQLVGFLGFTYTNVGYMNTDLESQLARSVSTKDKKALVYFIGPSSFVHVNIDYYNYIGIVDKKSFIFSYINPGDHIVQTLQSKLAGVMSGTYWQQIQPNNNISKINFEAGKVYYIQVDGKKPAKIYSTDKGHSIINKNKLGFLSFFPNEFYNLYFSKN